MIKVAQIGMGPIAQKVTRYLSERSALSLVGAIDIKKELEGKDAGELAGISPLGIKISSDLEGTLKAVQPDVAIVSTASTVSGIAPTLEKILFAGINVVTSCEELFFTPINQNKLVQKLDEIARDRGVTLLGTGVNPGFLMDYLPVVLSSLSQRVDSVFVERIQDASTRRVPFQKKIGAGLSEEEFARKAKEKTLRHVGLTESLAFLLHSLNLRYEKLTETLEPVREEKKITGVLQIALATTTKGTEVGKLVFKASVGEKDPRDRIVLKGEPNTEMIIPGAAHGDIATCAMLINAIPSVLNAEPGYKTMADIQAPHYF